MSNNINNKLYFVDYRWLILVVLLKDTSRVKPYNGAPFKLNIEIHQNIFAGNSFLSFLFGTEAYKGEE